MSQHPLGDDLDALVRACLLIDDSRSDVVDVVDDSAMATWKTEVE